MCLSRTQLFFFQRADPLPYESYPIDHALPLVEPSVRNQARVVRTERIWVKPHPTLSHLCHLAKNLFNEANFLVRQTYFSTKRWVRATELHSQLHDSSNFMALSQPTAQKILTLVERAWKSFFVASADWKSHPKKYFQQPRPPKYKRKDGEFLLWFSKAQLEFVEGQIRLPSLHNLHVRPRRSSFQAVMGVRVVPQGVGYVIEILYSIPVPKSPVGPPVRVAGIDLGLANLITLVNNIGESPIVVKGGVAKSINQYYNKERARLQGVYARQGIATGTQLLKLNAKRKRKFTHYFHEVSRFVVDWCQAQDIDTLIIGRNKHWKQHLHLGKRTNQNFVFIPFWSLVQKIHYKATDAGIRVLYTDEAYTSRCSFLDGEPIAQRQHYFGKRIARGLFQTQTGTIINSDVNGGYNIVKKAVPNAFADGIEDVWLHPVRWKAMAQSTACQHLVKVD